MNRSTSRWLAPLVLMSISTLLSLGLVEVGLRLFAPQKLYRFPGGLFRPEGERVYGLSPGFRGILKNPEYTTHVRINSLGFRGREVEAKSAGARRVLVVGDSFVSAFNVEEQVMFTSVLEMRLREASGDDATEVINAGVPGYGTWHEREVVRSLAGKAGADLVVLCVYVGNDLFDNTRPRAITVQDGFLVHRSQRKGLLPASTRAWLQRNSMTYVFLWRAWDQIRPLFGLKPIDQLADVKAIMSKQPTDMALGAYDASRSILQKMAQDASGLYPVLVVLIPVEVQVYPDPFLKQIQQSGESTDDYDMDLPCRMWTSMAMESDLRVLDLLPVFRSQAAGEHLYMSLDGHLSRRGNEVTGQAIAEAVTPLLPARGSAGE